MEFTRLWFLLILELSDLVNEVNECFKAFDLIVEKHGVEKIKTIGDAYMCAGGIPITSNTHAIDCVLAAIEIQGIMTKMKERERK